MIAVGFESDASWCGVDCPGGSRRSHPWAMLAPAAELGIEYCSPRNAWGRLPMVGSLLGNVSPGLSRRLSLGIVVLLGLLRLAHACRWSA